MRTLAFLLILPCLCAASDPAVSVNNVAEMTAKAPGEFAADALIRLAAVDSVDRARKIELLNTAFERAGEAQEPLRRQPAMPKVPGAIGFLRRAFAQDLDGLTLRLRVVDAMAALDPQKAAALFARIPPLRLPKLTCTDFMVYNVAGYYEALVRIGSQAQTVKALGEITSPVQIGPAAKVVLAAKEDVDFQARLAAFGGAMRKISDDDRSFTFAGDLGPQILPLVQEATKRKMSPLPLLESYRLYLVNNQQTARCADNDLISNIETGSPQTKDEGTAFFNEKLRMSPLLPIQEQETTPTKMEGVAEGLRACTDEGCEAIGQKYNELVFNPETRTAYSPAQKNSAEWQAKMKDLLKAMAEWKPSTSITAAQYYRHKTGVYANILSLLPPGPLQEDVVKATVDFIASSDFKKENRIEWFLPANILVGRMALDPMGAGKYSPYLLGSKDPVIALYAALEAVAPRTPDKIMALM